MANDPFEVIVDALKEQLDQDWKHNGVAFKTGRTARDENHSLPIVIWVNPGGSFEPVDGIGPAQYDLPTGATVASNSVSTDELTVECDMWSADRGSAYVLRHRVFRAAHRMLTKRSTSGVEWSNLAEADDTAGHAIQGVKQRMVLTFNVPVLDVEEQDTALINTTPLADCFVPVLP